MRKFVRLTGLLALITLVLAASAWAQQVTPSPAPAPSPKGPPHFPAGAVKTFSGEVLGVMKPTVSQKPGLPELMVLVLKTADKTVEVKMGPPGYMEQQNFALTPGDRVEVKGARHPHPHEDTIIATEVRKGGQVLRLRDEHGRPLWKK